MLPTQQCSHNSRTYHHGSAPTVATQDQQCITVEPPVCYPNCPFQDNINMFNTLQCSNNSHTLSPRTYQHGSAPTVATRVDHSPDHLCISAEPPVCHPNCPFQDTINMFHTLQCSNKSQTLSPRTYQHGFAPTVATHVHPFQDQLCISAGSPVCYTNCPFQDNINMFHTLQCSNNSHILTPRTYQHGSAPPVATHVDPSQDQLCISAEPPVCYTNCPSQDNIKTVPTLQCAINSLSLKPRTYQHEFAPTMATHIDPSQDQQHISAEPPVCATNCPFQDTTPTLQCSNISQTLTTQNGHHVTAPTVASHIDSSRDQQTSIPSVSYPICPSQGTANSVNISGPHSLFRTITK